MTKKMKKCVMCKTNTDVKDIKEYINRYGLRVYICNLCFNRNLKKIR